MNLWALAAGEAIPHSWELGPITRSDCVRYQGASGDFEPIHHDEPFARDAGYDAPLIIGMYPAGAVSAWMATLWGVESVRETTIRWTGQVCRATAYAPKPSSMRSNPLCAGWRSR